MSTTWRLLGVLEVLPGHVEHEFRVEVDEEIETRSLLEVSDVARQSLVQVVDGAVRITCT